VNEKTSRWAIWLIPLAAAALIFGPALIRGESLFLRVAWDPNNVLSFYPWNLFSAHEFAAGRFPLWNPHNACGAPHLANWQSAPFYPLHLLLFIHPSTFMFDIFYLARLTLLAVGTWLAARALGMGRVPAICAATAAAFSGYFMAYGPMVHMNVEALFPWALWLIARQKEQWRMRDWFGLVAVYAAGFLGGNGESAFYLVGFSIAFAFWLKVTERRKIFFGSVVAFAAAMLIATPQLLPFFEYFVKAWHIHAVGAGSQWLAGSGIYSIVIAVSGQDGGLYVPYLGAAVLLLAVVGATLDKRAIFFLAASVFIFGLVYGAPGLKWVTRLPGFSRMASYKYALAPLTVMVALLAGMGIEGMVKGEISTGRLRRAALALGVFAAAFPLGAWIDGRNFNFSGAATAIISLAAVALFVSVLKNKSAPALAAIIACELILNARALGLKQLFDPVKFADRPEARYLVEHEGHGRAACQPGLFPPNLNLVAGFDDINLFDAVYPLGYYRKMAQALGLSGADDVAYFKTHGYSFPIEPASVGSNIWRESGVRYYFGDELSRPWMKHVVGKLWEDPSALAILTVDNNDTAWTENKGGQDLVWRGDSPGQTLRARITRLPGWRAWADGVEVTVAEWSGGFIESKTAQPAREIRLCYMPWGWRLGLWCGVTSLLFLIGVLICQSADFPERLKGGA